MSLIIKNVHQKNYKNLELCILIASLVPSNSLIYNSLNTDAIICGFWKYCGLYPRILHLADKYSTTELPVPTSTFYLEKLWGVLSSVALENLELVILLSLF